MTMPAEVIVGLVYAFGALVSLVAVVVLWPRRDALGARPLGLMMLAAAVWAAGDAVEQVVPTLEGKRLVAQIQYVGVVSAAPLFFLSAMALAGRAQQVTRALLVAVWSVPLLSLLAAWTNPWHGWLWTDIRPPSAASPFATYEYGWWFWVLTAQTYVLMAAGSFVLVHGIRRVGRGFRMPMALVLLAVGIAWAGNAAYNAKLGPWPGLNWLTLSLGASGWLLVWVVRQEGLFDLLPRARGALFEMMSDGVVVIDRRGVILYRNAAARDTLRLDAPALVMALDVPALQDVPLAWTGEAQVDGGGTRRWLDLRVGPVYDRWGEPAGRLIVGRDVTMQKALEDERERLIDELQDALGRIVRLEGMLPICAQCHNVRDDRGYWNRIEDYLGSRAPIEFTHAICPDCMEQLYPETPGSRKPH
jgi:PAS domain-containing protein